MSLTEPQWSRIVERIQGAYQREVTPETWTAWYDELRGFGEEEVLDAVRRCIREQQFLTVAHIYKAIDANHKQAREERERFESLSRQRAAEGKQGVPAPPEFKKALRVFDDPTSRRDGLMTKEARDEIWDLGQKIMDRGPEWVPDDERDEYLASGTRLPARDPSGAWS